MNSMETDTKSTVVNTKGKEKDKNIPDDEISLLHVEATKSGLRILSKAKWEELRAEYLLYRQELVDEINKFQDEGVGAYGSGGRKRRYVDEMHDQEEQITEEDPSSIHPNSTYPPGCLVFVRNVHPQTNKTSLRNLFLHAREPTGIESGKKQDDGLDYLDYTKGMDCVCVLFIFVPSCLIIN